MLLEQGGFCCGWKEVNKKKGFGAAGTSKGTAVMIKKEKDVRR